MPTRDAGPHEDLSAGPFGPAAIVCGDKAGSVSAGQGPGFVWIRVVEEPKGEDFVGCIRLARETGLLTNSGANTLVDLTGFHGVVNWDAIHAVRDIAPWGQGAPAPRRIAYVSTDRMFAALVRLVAGLFPDVRHRLFKTREDALAWLEAAPQAGSN